jgi:hypothetical protein
MPVTRSVTRLAIVLAVLAPAALARAQPVEFTLKVSPMTGTLNDEFAATVQITIRGVNGPERFWPPDFGDFVVIDQRTNQKTQWSYDPVRGQEISNVETRRYRLKPQRTGRLRIAPARLKIDGKDYETNELAIEVLAAGQQPPPAAPNTPTPDPQGGSGAPGFSPPDGALAREPTFLHVVVDRQKVKLGEQVTVTWLLYTRSDVLKFEPKPPKLDGFWVETLFEPRSYFTYHEEMVGGREYAVATVAKRALFPTRAGRLTIPPYEAEVATMFTSFSAPLKLRSSPVAIEVDALPGGAPPGFDNAYVGNFAIETSVDRDTVPAGEALTLTLVVRGDGAIRRARVPPLSVDGFRVTPPRDFDERIDTTTDIVRGERRYPYLLTPTRGGSLPIGPIELPFYDAAARKYDVARAEAITVKVIGDPQAATAQSLGTSQENVIGKDIRPNRDVPKASGRIVARAFETRWLLLLVLAPGVVFLLVVVVDKVRERWRRETPRARLRRARGRARKRLRVAELHIRGGRAGKFFGEIARVLNEHIEERVGEPVAAMTRDQLREFLLGRGFPAETVDDLVRELENCDFARFAPSASGPGEMRAAIRRVKNLLGDIERVRPTADKEAAA